MLKRVNKTRKDLLSSFGVATKAAQCVKISSSTIFECLGFLQLSKKQLWLFTTFSEISLCLVLKATCNTP